MGVCFGSEEITLTRSTARHARKAHTEARYNKSDRHRWGIGRGHPDAKHTKRQAARANRRHDKAICCESI